MHEASQSWAAESAPIAVVGMSCRVAGGVTSPEELWDRLTERADLSGALPPDRWSTDEWQRASELTGREEFPGYYLDDIDSFDSDFFILPPREAATLDFQQRLALELSCEALQNAGIPPRSLAGTQTGVYFGVGAFDFGQRCLGSLESITPWSGIGSSHCGVANRISYALDLRGPSVAIDTACSASMVAIHNACQALRTDEIEIAIVGGVNVISAPGFTVALAAAGATSPTGKSRPFDQTADGYVRGEGGGVLVLKTLAEARRCDDRIEALIVASSVGQEGRTNGIMAPDAHAQKDMIERTYARYGIDPATVSYVEAHGTGTPIGDPEEAQALAEIFGRSRRTDNPCLIGSIKANVGHLEAGSGVISVIKAAHIVRRGQVPGQANFDTPSDKIDWASNGLAVARSTVTLAQGGLPYRAGISGYGYGGTISHIVVEAPSNGEHSQHPDRYRRTRFHIPFSGRSPAHLQSWATRLGSHLQRNDHVALDDLAHTLSCRTQHQRYRATLSAAHTAELALRLNELGRSTRPAIADAGKPDGTHTGCVFVFSGHGSQWSGMASDLFDIPAFTSVIDRIDDIYAQELGIGCRELLLNDDFTTAQAAQAAIFAMQCGIAEVVRHYGITPAAIIGQSIGEIAASVEAGAMSLNDGARLACRKARLVAQVDGAGAMLLVEANAATVSEYIRHSDVTIAIITSPESVVIAGSHVDVEAVGTTLKESGIGTRRVASEVAFHSDHMDPLVEPLRDAVQSLGAAPPSIPLYTTTLEDARDPQLRDADYWCANLRNPVNLVNAVGAALNDSFRTFVEISPHPLVTHALQDIADDAGHDIVIAHSVRRAREAREEIAANLAALFKAGESIEWPEVHPGHCISLPPRPWIRRALPRVHRMADTPNVVSESLSSPTADSMLGAIRALRGRFGEVVVAETAVDYETRPYPGTHAINGVEIVPAAVIVNSFLPLGDRRRSSYRLANLQFVAATALSGDARRFTVIREQDKATLSSADPRSLETVVHATADFPPGAPTALAAMIDVESVFTRCTATRALDELRQLLQTRGVLSDTYEWDVTSLQTRDDELIAKLETTHTQSWAAALDACFTLPVMLFDDTDDMRMASAVETIELEGQPPQSLIIHARRRFGLSDSADITILDAENTVCGHLGNAQFVAADLRPHHEVLPEHQHLAEIWERTSPPASARPPTTALYVVGDEQLANVLQQFSRQLQTVEYVATPEEFDGFQLLPDSIVVSVCPAEGGSVADLRRTTTALLERLSEAEFRPRFWLLSRDTTYVNPVAAANRGIARALAAEYPEICRGAVRIQGDLTDGDAGALVTRITGPAESADVLIREGQALDWRLARIGVNGGHQLADTYILTDRSPLTIDIATELCRRGVTRVVLLTGGGGETDIEHPDNAFGVPGNATEIAHIDLPDQIDATTLRRVLAEHLADGSRTAVLHPMGTLRAAAPSAGADGGREIVLLQALHNALPPDEVDTFVTMHGIEHIVGLRGCAAESGAATFASALMHERRRLQSTPSWSVAWAVPPHYLDVRLRASYTTELDLLHWSPAPLTVLLSMLTSPPVASSHDGCIVAAMTDDAPVEVAPSGPTHSVATRSASASDVDYMVRECISVETTLSLEELSRYNSLRDIGADSVLLLSIRRALERTFKTKLPASLLWDAPSVSAISDHLRTLVGVDHG